MDWTCNCQDTELQFLCELSSVSTPSILRIASKAGWTTNHEMRTSCDLVAQLLELPAGQAERFGR